MIALVELVANETDEFDYTTYVFKRLEECTDLDKYIMCIRYPNWNCKKLQLGDIGYVHCEEIRAGIDKWFNGTDMIPYNYNTVQFIRFIYKPKDYEYIME